MSQTKNSQSGKGQTENAVVVRDVDYHQTLNGEYVLLPSHTDPELGQPIRHYHLDPRIYGREIRLVEDIGQPIHKVERYPMPWPEMDIGVGVYLMLLYYYEGMTLRDGKCPHKGIEVAGGQCPAHGLRFDSGGKVIGTLKECYLQAGDDIGLPGVFTYIQHRFEARLDRVYLMFQEMRLASSKVGPFQVAPGDKSQFTFSLGGDNAAPIHPPTSCRDLPKGRSNNTRHALPQVESRDE